MGGRGLQREYLGLSCFLQPGLMSSNAFWIGLLITLLESEFWKRCVGVERLHLNELERHIVVYGDSGIDKLIWIGGIPVGDQLNAIISQTVSLECPIQKINQFYTHKPNWISYAFIHWDIDFVFPLASILAISISQAFILTSSIILSTVTLRNLHIPYANILWHRSTFIFSSFCRNPPTSCIFRMKSFRWNKRLDGPLVRRINWRFKIHW